MLQKLKIPIIIVVTSILTQVVGYAVHAAMPEALLPAGSTRYAAAYGTSAESVGFGVWANMPGMTKYVSIPAGKTADVIVIFCGDVSTAPATQLQLRAVIRDVAMAPDFVTLLDSKGTTSNQCAVFQKSNVGEGSPAVKIQWAVNGIAAPFGYVNKRSLLVILNIH
jgi:hypothetical protein